MKIHHCTQHAAALAKTHVVCLSRDAVIQFFVNLLHLILPATQETTTGTANRVLYKAAADLALFCFPFSSGFFCFVLSSLEQPAHSAFLGEAAGLQDVFCACSCRCCSHMHVIN